MKKILIALAAALTLASCNQGSSDGYYFEKSERLAPAREIKIVTYKSLSDVKTAFKARPNAPKLAANAELQAFSVIDKKTCTIHMVDPAVRYMPEFIGHELTHCLYGEFHPSQNERR